MGRWMAVCTRCGRIRRRKENGGISANGGVLTAKRGRENVEEGGGSSASGVVLAGERGVSEDGMMSGVPVSGEGKRVVKDGLDEEMAIGDVVSSVGMTIGAVGLNVVMVIGAEGLNAGMKDGEVLAGEKGVLNGGMARVVSG